MATQANYVGDGATVTYSIPFEYVSQGVDLKATVDGVEAAFTLDNAATLRFAIAPVTGAAIRIYRETPYDERGVVYADTAVLGAQDLNAAEDQTFRKVQEVDDKVDDLRERGLQVPPGEVAIEVASLQGADGKVLAVVGGVVTPVENSVVGAEQAKLDAEAARDSAAASAEQAEDAVASTLAELHQLQSAAEEARNEAEQSAGIAQGAALSTRHYRNARSYVPQGLKSASVTAAGSGGADGTYVVPLVGDNLSVDAFVNVTVSGGAVTAASVNAPGLYIGNALAIGSVDLSGIAGLVGAIVTPTGGYLVNSGEYYYTNHASDQERVSRFQNQANVAVEVDASVDYLNIALSRGYADQAKDAVQVTRPFNVPAADLHPALARRIKRLSIAGKPPNKHLRFGLLRRILSGSNQLFQADVYLADDTTSNSGLGLNASLAGYFYMATGADALKGDVEIPFTPSGGSGMRVSATVGFNADGSVWVDNLGGGTFANSRVSPAAEADNPAVSAFIEDDIRNTFNRDGRLIPGGRYVPMADGHSEEGATSAILGYPNFLSQFIKSVHNLRGFIDPYVARIIISPTSRSILIKDAARGTSGAIWNDPTGSATPSTVPVAEYGLADNVALAGELELDWGAVPPSFTNVVLNYTPAQGRFHPSVYASYAAFADYLERHDHQVVIQVGPDKASFTGSVSGTTLTVSGSAGRLTPGLVLKGSGVAAGTTIVGYLGATAGGDGTYQISTAHTLTARPMTAGREYTDAMLAAADQRCALGSPTNKVLILLDAHGGTLANPIEYPVQGLALKAWNTLASTGHGAALVPVNPASAVALVEMLQTSKVMNLQAKPTLGYAFHTRPGASGGPGGYGVQDRKMQGIFNVLIKSGLNHQTRHIAGDASSGMRLVCEGVRHLTENPIRNTGTNEFMYMHDVTQHAVYPNLAMSEGMRWTIRNCSSVGPSPLVKWQALDNGNPFAVQSTIELYGNTPGSVILVADSGGNHTACVIGIHGGAVSWGTGTPDIEVSAP